MNVIDRFKLRLNSTGFWLTIKYLLMTVFLEAVGISYSGIYAQNGRIKPAARVSGYTFRVAATREALGDADELELARFTDGSAAESMDASFTRGELCALGFLDGQLGCVCWLKPDYYSRLHGTKTYLIWRCYTLPEKRGRGLYPLALADSCRYLREQKSYLGPIVVECSLFNTSSISGILKSGFTLLAKRLEIRKRGIYLGRSTRRSRAA